MNQYLILIILPIVTILTRVGAGFRGTSNSNSNYASQRSLRSLGVVGNRTRLPAAACGSCSG